MRVPPDEIPISPEEKPLNARLEVSLNHLFHVVVAGALAAMFLVVPSLAQSTPPAIVSTVGYINGTPLTTHTANAFNSSGASTLVAFVSTDTPWNGAPISINGVSDNLGNSWSVLKGPTIFSGSSYTLLSAVYYVNSPITSSTHLVTVQLSNPAPLVFHVFAVSGSDMSGPPLSSAITDPGTGGTSANVTSAPLMVPNNSLLLSWAKNETGANASALNGYTLDGQSTSYLWAESQTAVSAGTYSGQFQYDSAIGWQTAIVGLKPSTGPVAFSQAVNTEQDTPVNITLTANSPQGFPLAYSLVSSPTHGNLSGSAPNVTYTPSSGYIGTDSFTFRVNDGVTNSNTATVSILVRGLAPFITTTQGYINSNAQTVHTSSTFSSTGATSLIAFVGTHNPWNGLTVNIRSVSDNLGNSWSLLTGPTLFNGSSYPLWSAIYYVNSPATSITHTVTVQLSNPAPLVLHVFAVAQADVTGPPISSAITDPGTGASSAIVTTAPITIPVNSLLLSWLKNETGVTATAVNGYTLDSQSTGYLWAESQTPISSGSYTGNFQLDSATGWQTAVVGVKPHSTAPPTPSITSSPTNPSNQTSASFSFSDTQAGVSFLCQLDGSGFNSCTSPATYSSLSQGSHTFSVKAQDAANNQSGVASYAWVINTAAPPAPAINSGPSNPTTQANASFTFSDTQSGVSFICQLDGAAFGACSSPTNYSGLSQGNHTFNVKAQDSSGNQSATTTFSWSIIFAPTVTGVSPSSGPSTGGTAVTISGTNFVSGSTVTFGGTAATNAVVVNSTTITASTPAHSVGAVTITVTANGVSGNLISGFTYAAATIGFAQVAAATPQAPTATVSLAFPASQTAGDLNVIAVGWNDVTSTVQSVTDSAGNNYSLAIGPTSGTGLRQSIYYAPNIVGGSNTVKVTFNQAAVYPDVRIAEYRGVTTLDAKVGAAGSSATASSGTATTGTANELIVGADMVATSTAGAGTGFITRVISSPDGDILEDEVVAATGSYSANATLNGAGAWVMQMVTFSAPTGPAPTITSVSPSTGPAAGGTGVTITGTNFAAGATVTIGAVAATNVVVVNTSTITANTPAGAAGPATVTVTNPGGQNGSLVSAFAYVAPPTVSSVSPSSGPITGGTAVTIGGANFAPGATVTFGSAVATNVVVVSGTQIAATTPAGTAGAVVVSVTNSDGQKGTLSSGFTYAAPPTVTRVSPNSGSTAGGALVTITGSNFVAGATVAFGGTAATNVTLVNSTTITATTPPGTAGPVLVTVTIGGQSGSLSNGFTYVVIPTVSSVSPNNGPAGGGTAVSISGTNFAAGATVTFGNAVAANVVVVSGTQITATTPAGSAGAVTVAVTVNGQTGSLSNGFTYVVPPTVTAVSPNNGSTAGGTAVTISGANFATGAAVTFGTATATNVVVVSGTQITATTPAGIAGSVTVTVTNPGAQSGSLASGFTYVIVPTVSSVSPNNGLTTGGTAVTITGTNFAAGATVTFGGTAAPNVAVLSGTQITATTPAHAAGGATVTVTVNGQTGSLNNGFTYNSSVAIGFAQVAAATPQAPTTTVSLAFPAAQTAGDLNVVVVGWNDTTSTVQSVTDSAGNNYSLAIGPTSGTGLRQSIYYAPNIVGGSNTVKVTFNQAAVYPDVRIVEYRGVTTLDAQVGATGSSATASSGTATTSAANELIVGADMVATRTKAAGTSFTSRVITSPDGDNLEDRVVTATGSYSATATLTTAGPWVMQMVTFK